jgi:hypothetical protein
LHRPAARATAFALGVKLMLRALEIRTLRQHVHRHGNALAGGRDLQSADVERLVGHLHRLLGAERESPDL